ncbi:DUF2817 domain-containing protein [Candidatus Kaiserbacteria bacterium]|nr:DUF2817 domain-containing protein [Candidatus Kaiserbacteria bacterium]MCB9817933.1 DUF2817 domain-containing protein [Candidatus Nomurabacteria bacterium]
MNSKNIVVVVLVLVLIGAVSYLLLNKGGDTVVVVERPEAEEISPVEPDGGIGDGAEPIEEVDMMERGDESVIGTSVEGDEIVAYHIGNGDNEVLLIGGVHGSYSPNTSALADEAIKYYTDNPDMVPGGVMLTIIPNLNPDGLAMTGTQGRFNSNNVDLNRNFDCEWSAEGVWRDQKVSGGREVFSEPEAKALRDYVETYDPKAAIVLFSAEGKVYPSACDGTPSNASVKLAATYATAAGYPAAAEFNAYAITGDMVNWMAKQGIPSISVLLSDHKSTEWSKNKAGIEAVLNTYVE